MALVLASQSPRRRQLMALITPRFEATQAEVEEENFTAPTPQQLAQLLGQAKGEAVARMRPEDWVIGCDTVVDLKGRPMGKPQGPQQGEEMLQALSGTKHLVHTGVCLARYHQGKLESSCFTSTTAIYFAPIPTPDIQAYLQTPEAYDKAGGYGIQGWAARYIIRLEGCYYNVMGLPVAALYECLQQKGIL